VSNYSPKAQKKKRKFFLKNVTVVTAVTVVTVVRKIMQPLKKIPALLQRAI
jgi:hypothetical protein